MIAVIHLGTARIWYSTSDPDNSVQNATGIFAELENFFRNVSTGKIFMCTDVDGSGLQTWTEIYPVQPSWTQSTSTAADFIKNKPALATVATSGSYNDLSNKPTIPGALSFSTPTFSSATTSTQLSATRAAQVIYTFPTSMTSLITSQTLTSSLQIADDSAFTTNVATINSDVQGCSGLLSLTLVGRLQVQGTIPAGKYRRVVLGQTGGATVPTTLSTGQEVLL